MKKKILLMLLGVVVVEALDGLITYLGITTGTMAEGNGLMRSMVGNWEFIIFKTCCGILLAVWFWKNIHNSVWVQRALMLTVIAGAGLLVWNCAMIWAGTDAASVAQVNWSQIHDPAFLALYKN